MLEIIVELKFFEGIQDFNDAVSKTSWYISTIVDQVMEMDTGMDSLTRLFNRRYIDTILRHTVDTLTTTGLSNRLIQHYIKITKL